MKLLASPTSPFARKLRILLIEKQLEVEVLANEAISPTHPAFAHNPLGKVPVLLLDDGSCLIDSPLIADYLDGLAKPSLLPTEQRRAIQQWEALADGIADAAVLWFMETRRPESQQSPDFIARQRLKVERGFEHFAQVLASQPLVPGFDWTLAEIALLSTLDYCLLRLPELNDWSSVQQLLVWRARYANRLSVLSTSPLP